MDLLLRVSCGERPSPARESPAPGPGEPVQNPDLSLVRESREGVRSHLAIQVLLGHILAGGTRATLIREIGRLLTKRGPYAGSREELTPVRLDWPSAMPVAVTALWLLADPRAALYLPRRGWGTHLLNPESVRTIRHMGAQLSQATA
jgi:hypothetical protein